jgi:hypothetical protein
MDSQTVEVSNQQIEAVLHESAALAAGLRRGRTLRLILFLVIVVVLAGVGWAAYSEAKEFTSDKNLARLGDVAQRKLEQKQDYYMKQVQDLVKQLSPPLTKAFRDQATKDSPRFLKAVEKERQPFQEHVQTEFEQRLNKRLESLQPRYVRLLKEEFPLLKEEKQQVDMAKNLAKAMERLLKKYYVDDLHDEFLMLFNAWDNFPVAQEAASGQSSLEDQFIDALKKLLAHRLTHADSEVSPLVD